MRVISILTALFLFIGESIAEEIMPSPQEALQRLKEGNQRFISGKTECITNLLTQLEQSKEQQKPYAAILCCSDSRVPPELIFDESLGKLFIVRVAGNVSSDVTIGSIEYAISQLKVPLVVILGHESCGVIIAALKGAEGLPPFVEDLVKDVWRSAESAQKESNNFSKEVSLAVSKNVQVQMDEILAKSDVLQEAVKNKQTLVKGAIFSFKEGKIDWLP